MNILALETSCDETAAAVVSAGGGRVFALSDVVASQIEEHLLYGGVVPEIASRRHCENIVGVTEEALARAGVTLADIDAVAVTYAPGLIGALLVGVNFAKGIAAARNIPLLAVHHIRGHAAANYLAFPELSPPFLSVIIYGGHTIIAEVSGYTGFLAAGTTLDDAAGETFDKVARALGFPYPGGVFIDNAAASGDPNAFRLQKPHTPTDKPGFNFSFSGLKTSVVNLIHNAEQKGDNLNKNDEAASFQRTVAEILTEKSFAALRASGLSVMSLGGGAAANSGIRKAFSETAEKSGVKLYLPPKNLCGDNAAMIGAAAYYEWEAGNMADMSLNAYAKLTIEN